MSSARGKTPCVSFCEGTRERGGVILVVEEDDALRRMVRTVDARFRPRVR